MVVAGLILTFFLVFCFFDCLKDSKIKFYFDISNWICNFFAFGFVGLILGTIVSFVAGKFVPSEIILVETCVLEPVIAEGKEIFAIKNKKSSFSSYFYFTKGENDCPLEVNSILLEEKEIKLGEQMRFVNKYKKTPKGNLAWFFFSNHRHAELIFLSKKDIL